MKQLSIAIVGAGFIAFGAMSMAPAVAADLTRLDYSGSVSLSSSFLPLLTGQPGNTLQLPVEASVTIDNLAGRLEDEGDSELTIPFISYLKEYVWEFYNNSFKGIALNTFEGQGSIFSDLAKTNNLSAFKWFYNPNEDILTVDGYDFAKIESCLDSTCYITGAGSLSAKVPLPVLGMTTPTTVSTRLNFAVAQTATPVTNKTQIAPPTVTILSVTQQSPDQPEEWAATSQITSVSEPTQITSVPEPTSLLVFVGLGGFFTFKRKGFTSLPPKEPRR